MTKTERASTDLTMPVICPNCRAEYRQGSDLCSDCNAPLSAIEPGALEGKNYKGSNEYVSESYREIRSALGNTLKIFLLFPTCLLLTALIYITLDNLILRYHADGLRAFIRPEVFFSVLVFVCVMGVIDYIKRKDEPSNVRFFKSIFTWTGINTLILAIWVTVVWIAQLLIKHPWHW